MDHETALEAANEALEHNESRAGSQLASLQLSGGDLMRRSGPALPSFDAHPERRPREAWQLAGMIAVAVLTLALVVTLWSM